MGQHHFGLGTGRIPMATRKIAEDIAAMHDASLTTYSEPGTGPRYWFNCRNLGAPFDAATARAVREALTAVGLDIAKLGVTRSQWKKLR